jgi:hypothetical protein
MFLRYMKELHVRFISAVRTDTHTHPHTVCNTSSFSMTTVIKYTHLSVKFILTLLVLLPPALCVYRWTSCCEGFMIWVVKVCMFCCYWHNLFMIWIGLFLLIAKGTWREPWRVIYTRESGVEWSDLMQQKKIQCLKVRFLCMCIETV